MQFGPFRRETRCGRKLVYSGYIPSYDSIQSISLTPREVSISHSVNPIYPIPSAGRVTGIYSYHRPLVPQRIRQINPASAPGTIAEISQDGNAKVHQLSASAPFVATPGAYAEQPLSGLLPTPLTQRDWILRTRWAVDRLPLTTLRAAGRAG